MKKYFMLVALLFVLFLTACSDKDSSNSSSSNSSNKELSMEDFITAFENEGVEVDTSEKPLFDMIKAKDGVIFYMDGSPVKIYEYDSVKAIKDGEQSLPDVANWNKNDRFVLETSNEKAIEIFNSVK